jgi:hypothetical protein
MSTRHLLWRGVSSQPQDGVWIKRSLPRHAAILPADAPLSSV